MGDNQHIGRVAATISSVFFLIICFGGGEKKAEPYSSFNQSNASWPLKDLHNFSCEKALEI